MNLNNISWKKIFLISGVLFLYLFVRFLLSYNFSHFYLMWNLLLAILPLIFLYIGYSRRKIFYSYFLYFLSFLFLPNSIYLVTDFIHLPEIVKQQYQAPISYNVFYYFDLILFFCFAFFGIILYFLVLNFWFEKITKKYNFLKACIFIILISFINAFGIFIGRSENLRFNSWDIFLRPFDVLKESINLFLNPNLELHFLPILFSFTFCSLFSFLVLKIFIKQVK